MGTTERHTLAGSRRPDVGEIVPAAQLHRYWVESVGRRASFLQRFQLVGKMLDKFVPKDSLRRARSYGDRRDESFPRSVHAKAGVLQNRPNFEPTFDLMDSTPSPQQRLLGRMVRSNSQKRRRHKRDSMPASEDEPGVELVVDLPGTTRRIRLRHLSVQPMTQPAVEPARSFAFEPIAFAEECGSTLKLGGSGRRSLELTNECKQVAKFFLVEFFHAQRPLLG